MWIYILITIALCLLSFYGGTQKAKSDAFESGFKAGKTAALNNKKQLIRTAFKMGLVEGLKDERRSVPADSERSI